MATPTRLAMRTLSRRHFSTTTTRLQETVGTVGTLPARRPVGGFRGGILGFLLGFSASSALALYYLRQESELASSLLLASVTELQQSTAQVGDHLGRLEGLEKEVGRLKAELREAGKEDIRGLRGEMKKVYDGLHMELLDMRAHVWGVEQDLQKVVRTGLAVS